MKIQSILYPMGEICTEQSMYYRDVGECRIFNTYFNLFSVAKWKKYTDITQIKLVFEARGVREVCIYDLHGIVYRKRIVEKNQQRGEILLNLTDLYEIAWVSIVKERGIEPYFQASFQSVEEPKRNIKICLDICTYHREAFLEKNLYTLEEEIFSDEENEDHFKVYVVDNANSLQIRERGWLSVFANKNLGGSGGFTRGIIEAQRNREAEGFTHVLLMDDDIVLEPDALIRSYGILSYLKEEYKDIFIAGAMLREDYRYIENAAGERWYNGKLINPKQGLDLRDFRQCIRNEVEENVNYAGWWYCCISLEVATKENLPLPMFIHLDDVEYGLRNCQYGFIYLNGICVWHGVGEHKKTSIYEYYELRNNLLLRAIHRDGASKRKLQKVVIKRMIHSVLYYRYQDVKLNYMAVKDFCRGIEALAQQDGERLHQMILEMGYHSLPVECCTNNRKLIQYVQHFPKVTNEYQLYQKWNTKFGLREKLTFNGWIIPSRSGIISALPFGVAANRLYRVKKVFFFDPETKKGFITRKSYLGLFKSLMYMIRAVLQLEQSQKVIDEYCSRKAILTSEKFWKRYLGEEECQS